MTREEALQELKELKDSGDPESAHGRADDVLCNLLKTLGYKDVVEAYATVPKWYA